MSENMDLHTPPLTQWMRSEHHIDLRQTPTSVTMMAEASDDPKAVYFAWLDSEREKEIAALTAADVKHKADVEAFIKAHPDARWYCDSDNRDGKPARTTTPKIGTKETP